MGRYTQVGDPPTARQMEVLSFIHAKVTLRWGPTLREIADHFGLASTMGVTDHLVGLEKKGLLYEREYGSARALRLTPLGRVALGLTPDVTVEVVCDGTWPAEMITDKGVRLRKVSL